MVFTNRHVILNDERKGVVWVLKALADLYKNVNENLKKQISVILVGRDSESVKDLKDQIYFNHHFVNYITDYRLLSLLYQSVDVFICGSIEDTGPMMVSEALACGTPVVGFNTGILYNMVDNGKNGFKVPIKNWVEMSNSIKKILESTPEEFEKMSEYAYEKVVRSSSKEIVLDVINELLQ